ncbi:unnamed protein product [Symbiodinium natans]|uniref:C3H1-type domain-containing protein n=1 Tax=Symbiodinium natans TaxID=878477 RepID=A0A812J2X0_9DINO|nr:unnamed protein product [Symbiodinium natans]
MPTSSWEGRCIVRQNTFLRVLEDEELELMSVGWNRLSSWPTGDTSQPRDDVESQAEPGAGLPEAGDCSDCNPCVFFASAKGCVHGVTCRFCHAHPAKRDGPAKRARKDTRDKLKARVLRLIGSREEMQSQEGQDELQRMAKHNPFVRAFILGCLDGAVPTAQAEIPAEDRARILQPGPILRLS